MRENAPAFERTLPENELVHEWFERTMFQPNAVHPLILKHGCSLILLQTQDNNGNQIRSIVSEAFECEPHDYSREMIGIGEGDDPVGLKTDGVRTVIDIDAMTARTFDFDAGYNEIQGYFYACEQMIYGGVLEPEDYLAAMVQFLQQDITHQVIALDRDTNARAIWEETVLLAKLKMGSAE